MDGKDKLSPEEIEALVQAARRAPSDDESGEQDQEDARVAVNPAVFSPITESEGGARGGATLDLLLDVPLDVTVELGQTEKTVKDVLSLGPGSVIELNRTAGEPVDILANGCLIARGEVVVVDETFAVRIKEVVTPGERLRGVEKA